MATAFLDERHLHFRAAVQQFCRGPNLEDESANPRDLIARMGAAGLLRACVPSQFGGLREKIELRDLVVARAALGWKSGLLDTLFAVQGLGSYAVTLAGSDAQKNALLPAVANGEKICAFALTEPNAGSDVSALATTARRDGDHWILDGEKRFISNAGLADYYTLFARTGGDRHQGLSAFLIPGDTPGLAFTPITLSAPHPLGAISLAAVRLPHTALIGAEGDGFKLAMAALDLFRTSVGAAAVGMAARARDEALLRVKSRVQFGKPLAEFQATQIALADMQLDVATSTLLVLSAAHRIDESGAAAPLDASMAKLHATEAAQRVIDRAVQLFGGEGVVHGNVVERLYREVRALRIYEGTSEIQRLIIARALLRGA